MPTYVELSPHFNFHTIDTYPFDVDLIDADSQKHSYIVCQLEHIFRDFGEKTMFPQNIFIPDYVKHIKIISFYTYNISDNFTGFKNLRLRPNSSSRIADITCNNLSAIYYGYVFNNNGMSDLPAKGCGSVMIDFEETDDTNNPNIRNFMITNFSYTN